MIIDQHEFRIKLPNGQIRWLQLVCHKISSDSRSFLGFRGSLRDVTDRKIAEESVSILRGMLPICSFCKKSGRMKDTGIKLRIIFEIIPKRLSAVEFVQNVR